MEAGLRPRPTQTGLYGKRLTLVGRGSRGHAALNRRRWAAVRRAALARDNQRCQRCGRVVTISAEVHHVTPLEDGGAAYELANLVTLCRDCHHAEHGKRPDASRGGRLAKPGRGAPGRLVGVQRCTPPPPRPVGMPTAAASCRRKPAQLRLLVNASRFCRNADNDG